MSEPGRKEIHLRNIELRAWERSDGLYEVEGRLTDVKPHDFKSPNGDRVVPAGEPMHDVSVRVVFDADMLVHDVIGSTVSAPYDECFHAAPTLDVMKGLKLSAGWGGEVRKRLGGAQGCTHMAELLIAIATASYQALTVLRQSQPQRVDANGRPLKINSCFAYGSERTLVMRRWPQYFTGAPAEKSG